ncbi:MAG: hypothetical protein QW662_05415 [Nitrososphaerota archaeon]
MGEVVEGVRLVNLTLHEITIYMDRGAVSIPPSGLVAGVSVTSIDIPINPSTAWGMVGSRRRRALRMLARMAGGMGAELMKGE